MVTSPEGTSGSGRSLFFQVGMDRPGRLRPAALDLQFSPAPSIGPALSPAAAGNQRDSDCVRYVHSGCARGIRANCERPSAYLSDDMLSLCALQIHPAQRVRAHAALHRPPLAGYTVTGGYRHLAGPRPSQRRPVRFAH